MAEADVFLNLTCLRRQGSDDEYIQRSSEKRVYTDKRVFFVFRRPFTLRAQSGVILARQFVYGID